MMSVILRCLAYALICVFYAACGRYLVKSGIDDFKRGAYWAAGSSFLIALSFAVLVIKNAWLL